MSVAEKQELPLPDEADEDPLRTPPLSPTHGDDPAVPRLFFEDPKVAAAVIYCLAGKKESKPPKRIIEDAIFNLRSTFHFSPPEVIHKRVPEDSRYIPPPKRVAYAVSCQEDEAERVKEKQCVPKARPICHSIPDGYIMAQASDNTSSTASMSLGGQAEQAEFDEALEASKLQPTEEPPTQDSDAAVLPEHQRAVKEQCHQIISGRLRRRAAFAKLFKQQPDVEQQRCGAQASHHGRK